MPNRPLKAVTLTHVRYTKGDQLGQFLAWVSLVPVFISFGGFLSHFIFRREIQGFAFALGLLVSHTISELIKTSVQQARPETCALLETCDSHGWPSSHSQYMFFLATYLSLLHLKKTRSRVLSCSPNNIGEGDGRSYATDVIAWALAFLTMQSRVYLGYHTVPQVIAGASLGIVIGASWFWLVYTKLIMYFPLIEESAFAKRFYIKDTSHIPNVMKFEYDNARAARKEAGDKSK